MSVPLHRSDELSILRIKPNPQMKPSPDDAQLHSQAKISESEVWTRFWERLRLFALRRLGNRSDAEDVAQETLTRVIQALRDDRLRNPEALPSYVFQTARNVCLLYRRSKGREARAAVRMRHRLGSERTDQDPLSDLVSVERRRIVNQALQALKAEERRLIEMMYLEGKESAEIARDLGITTGALRVRKHRALQRLRQLI